MYTPSGTTSEGHVSTVIRYNSWIKHYETPGGKIGLKCVRCGRSCLELEPKSGELLPVDKTRFRLFAAAHSKCKAKP